MTPEKVNRLAMWATIGILVVGGVVVAGRWATGSTNDADAGPVVAQLGIPDLSTTTGAPGTVLAAEPVESDEETAPTDSQPSLVLGRHIEASVATAPSTSAPPTTATSTSTPPATAASSTTTSLAPQEAQPTTTTSRPPTLPPTTTAPTTTTLPATTTTTLAPETTTTTTTTTTTSDLPGLFLERFTGQPKGEPDEWTVRLEIGVDGTVAGTYRGQVFVSWSGDSPGSVILNTGGSGNASATVGPFGSSPITLTVTNVQAKGWIYMPNLNKTATSLIITAPDD